MKYHNGRPFSARDKNPGTLGIHCARSYMGGWWYKNCYKANLNGLYGINSNNQVELNSSLPECGQFQLLQYKTLIKCHHLVSLGVYRELSG